MSGNKLIIFCGGTGGHFYPGLTIAREFKSQEKECKLCLIGKHSESQKIIAKKFNIEAVILPILPIPIGLMGKIKFLFHLGLRILQARKFLIKEKPNYVLGMGSFTSVPSILAAKSCSIPIFLHDGNSFIGKANIAMSRFAKKIALAFPPKNSDKLKCSYLLTGMPLRAEVYPEYIHKKYPLNLIDSFNTLFKCNLKKDILTILIFGGSQGAATFNSKIPTALTLVKNKSSDENKCTKNFQVIHICGKGNKSEVEANYDNYSTPISENNLKEVSSPPFNKLIIEGTEDMGLLYSIADLVICRAGGSTIAELALYGKQAILVPYPYATNDHQRVNGEYYTTAENSIIVDDNDCESAKLADIITSRISINKTLLKKEKNAKKLSYPKAASNVIKMIENHL